MPSPPSSSAARASSETSSGSSWRRRARCTTGCLWGMHHEGAAIEPRGAYATSKRYAEEALLGMVGDGLCPVILRNGTVYGWSPRMRFDLVVNTFVKDALLQERLELHGGGWMWRPLVDVRDAADAMLAVLEAPADLAAGEIFNVLHSNY